MSDILYIFISCQSRFNNCYNRIKNMMKNLNSEDYIIVKGGYKYTHYIKEEKLLHLNCNDFYEGLPEKVLKTYKFISDDNNFVKYNFICKLDDDMIIMTKNID